MSRLASRRESEGECLGQTRLFISAKALSGQCEKSAKKPNVWREF